ncbi:MAG: TIGR01906 family membrane protein [Anaerolineales bacterium]
MKFVLSWLTALLVPLLLLSVALRLLLTPTFLRLEYGRASFPPDPYGFTQADRLHWAGYALEFIREPHPLSYLADLKLADGTPLFNERELRHMVDVQQVTLKALRIGDLTLATLLILGLIAIRFRVFPAYLRGLQRGGQLTLLLSALIGIFGALAFWDFFTYFHLLFFEGDTWLFNYSDTLIRLFPLQFWQDVFALAAIIVIAGALILAFSPRLARQGQTRV